MEPISVQKLTPLTKLIGMIRIDGHDISEVQAKLYDKDYLHVGAVIRPEPTAVEKLLFHIGEVVSSMALLARTGMREAPLPQKRVEEQRRSKGRLDAGSSAPVKEKEGWMREAPLQ